MKNNIFIQSAINEQGQTSLEVGFEDGNWEAIPSEFSSSFLHNHITIAITRKDFWGLQVDFKISETDVLDSLKKQFPNNVVNLIIGSKSVRQFR